MKPDGAPDNHELLLIAKALTSMRRLYRPSTLVLLIAIVGILLAFRSWGFSSSQWQSPSSWDKAQSNDEQHGASSDTTSSVTTTSQDDVVFNNTCMPVPARLQMTSFSQASRLEDFIDVDCIGQHNCSDRTLLHDSSVPSKPTAYCKFFHDRNVDHFPHTLQQLLKCWSFWTSFPTHQPALLVNSTYYHRMKRKSVFNRELLTLLNSKTKIKVVYLDQLDRMVQNEVDLVGSVVGQNELYQATSLSTTRQFVRLLLHLVKLSPRNNLSLNRPRSKVPRIAILDRKGERSLVNVHDLVQGLQDAIPNASPVRLEYFEEKSLTDQLKFFTEVDIVISPHGAQLSGLPLLAARDAECPGMLVEFLPHGYVYPEWFGSLAAISGVAHGFFYLGGNMEEDKAYWMASRGKRHEARMREICPSVPHVVQELVKQILPKWYSCQERINAKGEVELK